MNREAFFAALRRRGSGVFGTSLSQPQVEGVDAILDEGEKRGTNLFHLAAILAEVYHETGGQMAPVKETVYASSKDRNPPDATVIKRLETAFSKGQLPWVKTPYWRDGWFGRGLIQLTHKANYDKFGVTKQQALDLKTSVRIVFDGMEKGLFTGKKLADYDQVVTKAPLVMAYRYYGSRAIVNGDTAANGSHIETYSKAFETALKAAGYAGAKHAPEDTPAPVTIPEPIKPAKIEQGPSTDGNWLSALLASVLAIFNRK